MTVLTGLLTSSRVIIPVLRKLTWRDKPPLSAQNPQNDQLILCQEFNSLTNIKHQDPLRERQNTPVDYSTPEEGRILGTESPGFSGVSGKSGKTG